MKRVFLYLMAAGYVFAGVNHFLSTEMYVKIMPPYLPAHELLVWLSGVAEIVLGLGLLFPRTRVLAAWGIIGLLIAVFPANLYMWQERGSVFQAIPSWILWARMPIQAFLIWAAWVYTRPTSNARALPKK